MDILPPFNQGARLSGSASRSALCSKGCREKIPEDAGGIEAYDQNIPRVKELLSVADVMQLLMAERRQRKEFRG